MGIVLLCVGVGMLSQGGGDVEGLGEIKGGGKE